MSGFTKMSLSEEWLQELCIENRISPIKPNVVKKILPNVELRLRQLIEKANKFRRRGKRRVLKVEDINEALKLEGKEPLYGHKSSGKSMTLAHFKERRAQAGNGKLDTSSSSSASGNAKKANEQEDSVSLIDVATKSPPRCPLLPEFSLHWLAVDGVQPMIAENPMLPASQAGDLGDHPQLPKELCQLYYRVTGILMTSDLESPGLRQVLTVLREDKGLQELLPYFSQFIQREVKANSKSLNILRILMLATDALWNNPNVHVQYHLQQMLPAVFTCVVASKLCQPSTATGSSGSKDDHWTLRKYAAKIIANMCINYADVFPDLQARVCKTYCDALESGKSPATIYGGIVGLCSLGEEVIRHLLLPKVPVIMLKMEATRNGGSHYDHDGEMLKAALVEALGSVFLKFGQIKIQSDIPNAIIEKFAANKKEGEGMDVERGDNNNTNNNNDNNGTSSSSKEKGQHRVIEMVTNYDLSFALEALEEALVPYFTTADMRLKDQFI